MNTGGPLEIHETDFLQAECGSLSFIFFLSMNTATPSHLRIMSRCMMYSPVL